MDYRRNSRILSLLGERGTYGKRITELAQKNSKVYAITADLTAASGLNTFANEYPERFINVGIAEQNAIGVAAGIADEGYVPFVSTFSNFAALRGNEFVRHFMAYMKCNIKLVGLASGFSMELFGNTHYGLEDIAVLRAMPNIVILSPADCIETAKCVEYCMEYDGPVYLRLSGTLNTPIVYRDDYEFIPGRVLKLTEGNDAIIYATGTMVHVALEVKKVLENKGISVCVVNVHTIKPFDYEFVLENKDIPLIVSVEEHSRVGGLGSAISEVLSNEKNHGKHIIMGTDTTYHKAGRYKYMLEVNGLTAENIVRIIENNI